VGRGALFFAKPFIPAALVAAISETGLHPPPIDPKQAELPLVELRKPLREPNLTTLLALPFLLSLLTFETCRTDVGGVCSSAWLCDFGNRLSGYPSPRAGRVTVEGVRIYVRILDLTNYPATALKEFANCARFAMRCRSKKGNERRLGAWLGLV